jgi:hypothetical protein
MKTIHTIPIIKRAFWPARIAIIFFFIISLLGSCDSFVEVDLPESQLTSKVVFEQYSTADAALADIYSKIRNIGLLTGNSSGISFQLGNYSDELTWFGTPLGAGQSFYNNTLLPSNNTISEYWRITYSQIYVANAILEGSTASASLSPADKEHLQGEALFIRALLHFYLVNLYGEIPYITTTDYKINSKISKLPVENIYAKIILDLQDAASLLTAESSVKRLRPGKTAIYALLSRVCLYDGLWAQAASYASLVLNQTASYNLEPLQSVFLRDSKETIWQLQTSREGKNTEEASAFIFLTGPPRTVCLSSSLMSSFSADDLRKANWTGSVTKEGSIWYYPFKYKQKEDTAVSEEYPVVLRLAEQYLIRAEALVEQGNLSQGAEDLNKIRNRAGLNSVDVLTKEQLLTAIYDERRKELFTEYSHRFFDLKRSGQINAVLSTKPGWNDTDIVFPLPQKELDLNPGLLPQNQGY